MDLCQLIYSQTVYDVICHFWSAFIKIRKKKMAENAASDGFGLNFSGAVFCLPHLLVSFLFYVWQLA